MSIDLFNLPIWIWLGFDVLHHGIDSVLCGGSVNTVTDRSEPIEYVVILAAPSIEVVGKPPDGSVILVCHGYNRTKELRIQKLEPHSAYTSAQVSRPFSAHIEISLI